MNDERRINFRVPSETWDVWDDKRHREKRSWQGLAEELFGTWFAGADLSTAVRSLSAEITKITNRPNPPFDPIVKTVLGQIVELGTTSAKLLEDDRRREEADGEGLDDTGEEQLREIENFGEEPPESEVPSGPDGGQKGPPPKRGRRAGGQGGLNQKV